MRLVTRVDFDGIVCYALLEEAEVVDSHLYCHPRDLRNGKIFISENDVLANTPYIEGCGLWFDHHSLNIAHAPKKFKGAASEAPSTARIIWDYYGGEAKFGSRFCDMMVGVDKIDSANLSKNEILDPAGWIMIGFIMDPRTGLGRHRHFAISNYELVNKMVQLIRCKSLDDIFEDPDVYARMSFYYEHVSECISIIQNNCRKVGKTIVFETRNITDMPVGNRFLIYGLYPECNVSVQIGWDKGKNSVFLSVGKSILDRSNKVDIAALMNEYGGGGHKNVGACHLALHEVDEVVDSVVERLNQ